MTTPSLPAITSLPFLDDAALVKILDDLFESSSELHHFALPMMRTLSLASYTALVETLRDQLLGMAAQVTSDTDPVRGPLLGILAAHPRLGESEEAQSAQSAAEQKSLQPDQGKEEAAEMLAYLNHAYEVRFPGLRYIVFVNARSREAIMEDMVARIETGDVRCEEKLAIEAMCDIALDRLSKLLKSSPGHRS